jgi:hypothetical protein
MQSTIMKKFIALFGFLPGLLSGQISTFQTDGLWLEPTNWDTGVVVPDNQIAIVNANALVDQNTGTSNTDNPSRIEIGVGVGNSGRVTVTGGTLSGAHGGGNGIFVGVNGGDGTLVVEEGATYRTQGGTMELAIGDFAGGTGFVSVAGVMQVYKFLNVTNGTLEMQPTGQSNVFNSNDQSSVGPDGTLSFIIDGSNVGSLERSNTTGLQMNLDPAATLKVTLGGDFEINDSWVLMRYTVLNGQFAQGESFVNEQGYSFSVDYGLGNNDELILTLVSDSERPRIDSFEAVPAAVSSGQSSTLGWTASNFDSLTLDPGAVDVTALSQFAVSPVATTTYTLRAQKGNVTVSSEVTVVVDELPEIVSFTGSDLLIAPGDSLDLEWSVSGAETVMISPQPGSVSLTGSATVSPASSTTYILTATNGTGSVTAEVEVVVDAIAAAVIHSWDPSLPGQTSGALLDSIGGKNFDLTGGVLLTDLTSENTSLTAAVSRVNPAATTGGDMGQGFPLASTSYEFWIRPGALNNDPQVVFETGGGAEGSCLLLTSDAVRFLHSTEGITTIDFEVPFFQINPSDFVHLVVTIDAVTQEIALYVKGAAGGVESATAAGLIGSPDGRASLFTWSGFGGAAGDNLGGTAGVVPLGISTFAGEVSLSRIYDRALSEAEVETVYLEIADAIVEADSDNDGLPDFWELEFLGDLSEDADDNNDGDLLTNLQELEAGTDPGSADPDADGLDDDVEIGLLDPTDPNDPDSDDDGLTDGEEVNGNPSSNPNLADTDADGFGDFFEVLKGSDPDDFASLPPADEVGPPSANLGSLGAGPSFDALFGAIDTLDATFRVCVDFEEKPDGDREVIFETGGATVGFSLVYEAGNQLVLRAAGGGGFELAVVNHTLTAGQLAAGEIDVVASYDVLDDLGNSAISLFLDGELVGSDSRPLGGDWTGTNGSSFGVASGNLAGDGQNVPLTGVAFGSGTINAFKGLTYYQDVVFEGGVSLPPVVTELDLDRQAQTITLTFTSSPGKTYTIESSIDLVTFNEIVSGLDSGGESTTTFPIALSGPAVFYRVVEE